jgi:hypothetical protein
LHGALCTPHSTLDLSTNVRILFGMQNNVKQIFSLGHRRYEIVIVDGLIRRGNRTFAAQFDHDAGLLNISIDVPIEQRAWVVAVAISDACFRLWKPIPVIWPTPLHGCLPDGQDAFSAPRLGPADDRPHQ